MQKYDSLPLSKYTHRDFPAMDISVLKRQITYKGDIDKWLQMYFITCEYEGTMALKVVLTARAQKLTVHRS